MSHTQDYSRSLFNMPEAELERPHGSVFCRQLSSTIKLHTLHRTRTCCSSFFELFLPLFVLSLVVSLSYTIKNETGTGENFVDYSMMNKALDAKKTLFSSLCYDPQRAGGKIDGLESCNNVPGRMTCFTKKDGLPLDGICLKSELSSISIKLLTNTLCSSYGRYIMPVPAFDEMVKMQWIWKCVLALFPADPMLTAGAHAGSIGNSGWLYVTPRNAQTEAMVAHLNTSTNLFKYVFLRYFDNTAKAESYLYEKEDAVGNWGVITLNAMATDPAKPLFDVVIRLNSSSIPEAGAKRNTYYGGGRTNDGAKYILSGFTTLQKVLYEYFMVNAKVKAPETPLLVPMGTVNYVKKTFLSMAEGFLPLIVFGFLYPVSQTTRRIVLDKELRIKEALLIMGLRQSVQYLAWVVFMILQYAVLSLAIAMLLKFTILKDSAFLVICALFFLFSLSTAALAGLLSTFFSRARTSSVVSPFVYLAFAAPVFALSNVSGTVASVLCVLSPTAFAYGMKLLFSHELASGFAANEISSSLDSPNMMFILLLLLVDTFFYFLLMLYFDAVIPNEWGTTRHPLFFITDLFSRYRRKDEWEDTDGRNPNGVFEPLTDAERKMVAVQIRGIKKSFKRGTLVAVNHMHWDLLEGDISVLLGHNGAGKSTAMSIMTGMITPDSGDCFIYGHSIRKDLSGARQEIGFCPQHNILWPRLTCYEHLEYYSSIKGLSGDAQKKAIEYVLNGVDLQEKRNSPSSALSGGQKRKLSIAIAFVGNSRLVLLDEPTAGMDVAARRHTWDLLRKLSARRTILLSTHFMDEADFLGNRIAIMSKGSLQCAGSSLFLKSNLGVGYNITLSVSSLADFSSIQSLIQSYVPPAETLSCTAGEISFRLPMSFVKNFSEMLRDIEQSGKAYGIQSYTFSATTLEEIFLSIAHGGGIPARSSLTAQRDITEDMDDKEGLGPSSVELQLQSDRQTCDSSENIVRVLSSYVSSLWSVQLVTGESAVICSQLKTSLTKRFILARREYGKIILQIIFPVALIILAMLLENIKIDSSRPLVLSSNMYKKPVDIDLANCNDVINTNIPFAKGATSIVHSDLADAASLSSFYIKNYLTHSTGRYTGLACKSNSPSGAPGPVAALFFNFSAPHAASVNVLGYYGALVQKALSPASVSYMEDIFVTRNHPMPGTRYERATLEAVKIFLVSILIVIPFLCVPSAYIHGIVKEREIKARHLQTISGLRFSVYWFSNYIFDLCSYFLTMFLALSVMLLFEREEYVSREAFFSTFLLFFVYGFSSIAMSYAISPLFKEHSFAQTCFMSINMVTGNFFLLATFILNFFEQTKNAANSLKWGFRIFPSYCLAEGITNLATRRAFKESAGLDRPESLDVTGYPIIYMAGSTVLFLVITFILDNPFFQLHKCSLCLKEKVARVPTEEDEDVANERQRVTWNDGSEPEDLVRVVDLCKVYGNGTVAVNNVTFGVKPGEVFGLLGTNGAGKTTIISILCQDIAPTSGHAAICGNDLTEKSNEALRCVGYCPQFDALFGPLNVQEHLELYAGIRGVSPALRASVVEELISLCELTDYRKTYARSLSGGNRRKLSVAISLIGGPRVVFLDEPSAGLDPVARRGLWTAIQAISSSCSVVLTTHHLEEVEALAHRIAIMVDGTMRCLGSKTHLKNKYGSGFELVIRTKEDVPRECVEEFVSRNFLFAKLNEVRGCRYTYALAKETPLSKAFDVLEKNKHHICIEDYTISQTSIEQVFLRVSEEAEQNK